MTIRYQITAASSGGHYFDVLLSFMPTQGEASTLRLPSWIPGSYLVRDFARNIVEISARTGEQVLTLHKLDKDSWLLPATDSQIEVSYRVYANDLSVRTAFLDDQRGFFNGTSVFLAVLGQEQQQCIVDICEPEFPVEWRVATSLPRLTAPEWGFGRYVAQSYHALIDHPVEMANFRVVSFEACGVPHHMVVTGAEAFDHQQMQSDLTAICENHSRRFDDRPPFDEYWFLTAAIPNGFGGLEHMNSTALICTPESMPEFGRPRSAAYKQFLELCSHEYFHCWNVKRIQPLAFQPFDLSKENFTTLLWAFEGITSYYDQFGVLESGCIDVNDWLKLIGENITRVQRGQGRLRQTLRESSFEAWTKFYKQDENAENAIVSYYVKGGLLVMALDMSLRLQSDGRVTMDDVMRLLWRRHGVSGVGVPENGVEQAVFDVLEANRIDPMPCMKLLELGLDTHEELPLKRLLAAFGLVLNWRPRASLGDKGGTKPAAGAERVLTDHGITLATDSPAGVVVKRVRDNGPAARAGISANDLIVAIDGKKATVAGLDKLRSSEPPSDAEIYLFRRERLLTYRISMEMANNDTAWISLDESVDVDTLARRAAWLGCK